MYNNLQHAFINSTNPDLTTLPILSQYNSNNTIISITKDARAAALYPMLNSVIDYSARYNSSFQYVQPTLAYPRRLGFTPKRLAL
jgi:hypothetical protein